jgi:hypothetical protein
MSKLSDSLCPSPSASFEVHQFRNYFGGRFVQIADFFGIQFNQVF